LIAKNQSGLSEQKGTNGHSRRVCLVSAAGVGGLCGLLLALSWLLLACL
jgi:hypothetical protein